MLFSEADVQARTIVLAAQIDIDLFRNNSGVAFNPNGQPVRFGLGNTSKKINEIFKTPDLIGLDSNGVFVGAECKEPGWRFTGTKREIAQRNALNLFNRNGGFGMFVSDPVLFIHSYKLFTAGRRANERFRWFQHL